MNVICRIAVSAVSFNPFVLLLKGFLQLLGSVAEWGPVFNVSLELFWTASGFGSWNVIHLTNWAFNRTHGVPNPPGNKLHYAKIPYCKSIGMLKKEHYKYLKIGREEIGPEKRIKNIREAIKV